MERVLRLHFALNQGLSTDVFFECWDSAIAGHRYFVRIGSFREFWLCVFDVRLPVSWSIVLTLRSLGFVWDYIFRLTGLFSAVFDLGRI